MQALDIATAKQSVGIIEAMELLENKKVKGIWSLPKWDFKGDIELQVAVEHDMKMGMAFKDLVKKWSNRHVIQDDMPIGENVLLNAGINLLMNLLAGAGGTVYNNANGRIGVGDSSTAAVATQTGLQASTNKTYVAYDATYPTTGASQQFISRATFTGGSANYSWQEFTNDNGTTSLNRLASNQGTKTSGQTWQPTITITIS